MSEDRDPDLQFILFKRRNGQFKLAACRGLNKGCAKLRAEEKPKKPCPDCFICEDETMTLDQLMKKLSRGDA